LNRYSIIPQKSIFIDDNLNNIAAAREIGIDAIPFVGAKDLRVQLEKRGIQI